MAKFQIDAMLDAGLAYIPANATEMYVCTSQPATRAAAISTALTGAIAPTFQAASDGVTSGRKIVVDAKTGVAITATGTATHLAVCSGTTLLYVTTITSKALTSGDTLATPAWNIEIADVTP